MEYWRAVRARAKLVIVIGVLGAVAGIVFTISQVPVYRTHTSVKMPEGSTDSYATHSKMLQSEGVKSKALAKLRYGVSQYPPGPTDRITGIRTSLGFRTPSQEDAINQAVTTLEARAGFGTPIVDVWSESTDRRIAADFVNLVAREYVAQLNSGPADENDNTAPAVEIENARRALERSEVALELAEKAQSGLGGTAEVEARVRDLRKQLDEAKTSRVAKVAAYESAKTATPGTLATMTPESELQAALTELDQAQAKVATLRVRLTDKHKTMIEAVAAAENLQRTVEARKNDMLNRLRMEAESSKRREEELRAQLTSAEALIQKSSPGRPVASLRREADLNRQQYERLLEQSKQRRQGKAPQEASVLDQALPPTVPFRPSPLRNVGYGLFAGLLVGAIVAITWSRLDTSIQSPGELAQYTGVAELGVVPEISAKGRMPGYRVELVIWQDRMSPAAAAFDSTATSLLFLFSRQGAGLAPAVVLSSVAPMEGKTTACCNLAVAISEARRKVLLIDADVARPRIDGVFEVPNDGGLTSLLNEPSPLDEKTVEKAVRSTRLANLDVLVAGAGGEKTAELLHSPRLPELLAIVRAKYDFILIDTPPMLQLPNARVFGRICDGVVLVARANHTPRASLQVGASKLRDDRTALLGTILNGWNPKGAGYGYEAYTQSYKRYGASGS